ncbi:MAG TPA: VWA domain-containing protein [Thermoanaerobaculia bacterium]|jgi:Ca-activated chloride channel family protein|nr:VWA domain-containing protein [Thermoanaerobaculia bacterium]
MKALAAALIFAFAATILAQAPTPRPKPDEKKAAPPDRVRKLSKRERAARIEKLEVRHQDFVTDVEPIMLGTELDTFLTFETDAHRDAFVEDFWNRRDAYAGTSNRAFKDMYYTRLEVAKEQFKRVTSDRAKMFLIQGPPSEVLRTECVRFLQPIEIWKYPHIPMLGSGARLLFYKPRHSNEYRLWSPLGGTMALSDLVAEESAAFSSAESAAARNAIDQSASPYAYVSRIQLECKDGDEIMRAITSMVQSRIDLMKLFEPPQISTEDAQKLLRSVVIPNPDAPKLTAEFSVRYPTKEGSRTDVQMMLLVPRDQITPAQVAGAEVYTIDVVGEILRNGNLWEKYRYRFDFPGDVDAEKLPIVIDRLLRPADYVSRIKVVDANTGAEAVVESNLSVPEIFLPEPDEPPQIASTPGVDNMGSAPAKNVAQLKDEFDVRETRLRIVPPSDEIVSGIQTIETMITGDAVKGVEFWLDGRKIAVRRAPPYSLDLDFGIVPHTRRIRAVALDAKNVPITGDEVVVNTGTDPFRVRIKSPRIAPHLEGATRVEMDVRIPEGEELNTLELFWNSTRLATLYDAPFVQTVEIPATNGVGYLRAVATVKGDTMPPVEDVVMINTPAYMEELNVHLVELPTTVVVNGKPTSHLTEKAFKITDDGKPVSLAKFEYVKNLPLSIGLAIDSSGSMQPRMDEAQKAGAQFFEKIIRRGDKAFLVAFDTDPQLVQKWSTKVADMHAGLAKLRAEETTALYDAVVYALYNFQGIRGQRALILISDGKDTASNFTFDQALEYARRSGVPIYTIGIGIKATEIDVRFKLSKMSQETGGSIYYIEQARELQRIYDEIEQELRSQYILGFYPSPDVKPGGKWREVNVQVTEGKAKTIRGYFP